MADSLAALFNVGEEIEDRRIVEPLGSYHTVTDRVRRYFPDTVYSRAPNTLLYKFLSSILGEAGIGGSKKRLVYPRSSESVYHAYFSDLDALYGSVFGLTRTQEEIYPYSPENELLTIDQWREIRSKDSAFQARALKFARGVQMGSTKEGLALLCEAASGIECSIIEHWRYLDDKDSDYQINPLNLGATTSSSEIVVVPDAEKLSLWEERRISNIMGRFGPVATIFSINPRPSPRIETPIQSISASTTYFQAERFVTGSPTTTFPVLDPRYGLWIESEVEHPRPSFAFTEGQETITWITIDSSNASSFHVGNFNRTQQHVFEHQRSLRDPGYVFLPEEGFIQEPVKLEVTSPLLSRGEENRFTVVAGSINLGYFSDSDINNRPKTLYWASKEDLAPNKEFLEVAFGRERSVNYIEFEISTKPVKFQIQYQTEDQDWQEVEYLERHHLEDDREVVFGINTNVWHMSRINFERVQARAIRVVIERSTQRWPYPNSPEFPWSVEIRNLKVADILQDMEDLVAYPLVNGVHQVQSGRDILGNKYRTIIDPEKFSPDRVVDSDSNSFWQSSVAPDPFAVECLYLDIRQPDGRASTIDEFYIDPVTSGPYMHVYWSNDDAPTAVPLMQSEDDWRLWTPDPAHYILTKGRFKLRRPITAKYLKFEFTRLSALPYPLSDTQTKPVLYKTHPSWSEKQISEAYSLVPGGTFFDENGEVVRYNYETLGITHPSNDKLSLFPPYPLEEFDRINIPDFEQILEDYRTWEKQIDNAHEGRINLQAEVQIELFPFRSNLINILNPFDLENRTILGQTLEDTTFFRIEIPLNDKRILEVGSVADKTEIFEEKTQQEVWFPIRARHGYKVVESLREKDVGYCVAIKDLKVFRSAYRDAAFDYETYFENLVDDLNFTTTMSRNDSGWGLVPSSEYESPTNQEFGEYDFDYTPFVPWIPPVVEMPASDSVGLSDSASGEVSIANGEVGDELSITDTAEPSLSVGGVAEDFVSLEGTVLSGGSDFNFETSEDIVISDLSEVAFKEYGDLLFQNVMIHDEAEGTVS